MGILVDKFYLLNRSYQRTQTTMPLILWTKPMALVGQEVKAVSSSAYLKSGLDIKLATVLT